MNGYFAHTLPGQPASEWEPLEAHLRKVADLAAGFASRFEASDWGYVAGLWHDLGKFSAEFQEYLQSSAAAAASDGDEVTHRGERFGKVDHASAGAQYAAQRCPVLGHLVAFAISGHHSGLLDARADGACLEARLKKSLFPWTAAPEELLEPHELKRLLPLPHFLDKAIARRDPLGVAFFARMLFSCLVDADYLATEAFVDPGRARGRPRWPEDILLRIESCLSEHLADIERQAADTEVNRARREVREACERAAGGTPGLFSLTVPTGGGKTLASLSFALSHARRFGLDRIVYVIPFTSIIEQNAGVFRGVTRPLLAEGLDDPILEHHSNLAEGPESERSRLAAENWEAPIVVTTAVQFFESLFASRTSRCRKLHNLARSVVILDEAQTIPVDLLEPCLAAMKELVAGYGASVVLCTATQPALSKREHFDIGLEGVREIVADPPELYRRLRRVDIVDLGRVGDEDLIERLACERQILCIVNSRSHARKLAEEWTARGGQPIHLSAQMCPAHRSVRLGEIRRRLDTDRDCQVVSTQLVEAGVDLDFPVVFRSLAGVDAIAQAAGRCNREGRQERGRTFVFRSEHTRSEAYFRETGSIAAQVLDLYHDPLSPEAIARYFRLYYWEQQQRWDRHRILNLFHLDATNEALPFLFSFASAAERFRLIDEVHKPVIVPWGAEGRRPCDALRRGGELPARGLLRALQRFTVTIPSRLWDRHVGVSFELLHDRFPVLFSPQLHYSDTYGLTLDGLEGEAIIG